MGGKKWWWGVAVAALIAYALAANLMPLQETTVAVDREWSVAGPYREFCADVSITGEVTISRPFVLFRPAALARPGSAELRSVETSAAMGECANPDPDSAREAGEHSAIVKIIIGDASCTPWAGQEAGGGVASGTYIDNCMDSAERMQVVGTPGQSGGQGSGGFGDTATVSTHRGCVDVSTQVFFVATSHGATMTEGGEVDVERICPGDKS